MSDRILVPLMDGKCLAMSLSDFQQALKQGCEVLPPESAKPQDNQTPIWLPVSEVARLCNISETFLRDEISLKRICTRRFGRIVRIHRDYVEHQTGDLMTSYEKDD